MKNLDSIISGLSKSGLLSGFAGGLAGGALSGAMISKKGKKMGKSALKLGAMAAIGGVAYKAYQSYSQKKQPSENAITHNPTAAPRTATLTYSANTLSQQQFSQVVAEQHDPSGQMLLLRAMITAANADGHIDEQERQRIYAQVDTMELSANDKAALFDELRNPLSLDSLIHAVPNSETAIEVYAASVMAIDQSQAGSEHYLNRLAASLMIPKELVAAVHNEVQ